jgi:hypothetical protein
MSKLIIVLIAVSSLCPLGSAQDTQSLGDVARHAREQKQAEPPQEASASAQDDPVVEKHPKASYVVTNDEIPEQPESAVPNVQNYGSEPPLANYKEGKRSAEYWKAQILQMKRAMASLQRNIDSLNHSIHFAGGNYEKNVGWNNRQRQKLQQEENLQFQLNQLHKRLEGMQEAARRQGYGNAVYDP